ncbi:ABC transporter permease [Vulgatibacter incomptus]|uniref:ABC transporter permease protein n=1 Tax=Vulgatibacter incomptus TaxID=1391653 RepID=A0A0K1PF73_9BACT|nr:FtsX-like permease family protein [Vulgatibacter incomptus]AKU92183.1 ABC transporter permease protein [Vulgatibacter incomptus]
MGIYVKIALRNLLQARRRSLLLSVALGMVTTLLVVLLALSQGLTDNMRKTATTLASGHVNVGGFFKLTQGQVAPFIAEGEPVRKIIEENTPGLDFVIDRLGGFGKLISDTGSTVSSFNGIDPAVEQQFLERIQLAPERDYKEGGRNEAFGDRSRIGQPGTILLFAGQAKRLGVGVGDNVTITTETTRGAMNSAEFTVVAIARDMGMMSSWYTFVSKDAVRHLYRMKEESTGGFFVYLKDIGQADATMAHLRKVFEEKGYSILDHESKPSFMRFESLVAESWTGQRLNISTWEDEGAFLKWTIAGFNAVSIFLIGVLMLIIVVGIMNTMWMSVRERTSEVGTLRAIGMRRRRVLTLFVTEAILLGLAATAAGSLFGGAISGLLDAAALPIPSDAARMIMLSDTLHLAVEPAQLVKAIALFTLVTGFSALWPASRAARMRPVNAIHHVG